MEVGVTRERPSENTLQLATTINSLSATVAKLTTKVAKINNQPEPRTPTALRDAARPRRTRTREAVCSEMTDHAPDRWNVPTADELAIMHAIVDSRPPSRDSDRETRTRLRSSRLGKRAPDSKFGNIGF